MVLTPSGVGTHADENATGANPWPATGYNQANDLMQAYLAMGVSLTISAVDAAILDDAFGWLTSGISITAVNVGGTMSQTDMAIINNAIAAVNAFFPVKHNSPTFTWSVAEVPEPGSLWLFIVAGMIILFFRKRTLLPSKVTIERT